MFQVAIPPSCLPLYSDNIVPAVSNVNSDTITPEQTTCFHSESFHDEGSQWLSNSESCTMCSCHHSRVQCDPILCPPLTCTNPTLHSGDCCSTCDSELIFTQLCLLLYLGKTNSYLQLQHVSQLSTPQLLKTRCSDRTYNTMPVRFTKPT